MVASVPELREPPQRLAEPLGEVLGHDDRVLGRLREVGAAGDPLLTAATIAGWACPASDDAVPAVEVGVLAAVDVVDLRALAVADPHRLRLGDLPVGGGAAGQAAGPVAEGAALRLAGDERVGLLRDHGVELVGQHGGGGGHRRSMPVVGSSAVADH